MTKRKIEFVGPVCKTHGAVVRDLGSGVTGILRPLEEGKPIHGEAVSIGPRNEDGTHDMETLYDAKKAANEKPSEARSGPGYYATAKSREGWERTFGKKDRAQDKTSN